MYSPDQGRGRAYIKQLHVDHWDCCFQNKTCSKIIHEFKFDSIAPFPLD